MSITWLGLGSNVNAEAHIRAGIEELRERFGDIHLSPIYASTAVGFDGDDFLNMVVGLETDVSPHDLLEHVEKIHALAGRVRGPDRYSSRPLDIDLLLYGDLVDRKPPLRLPRRDVLAHNFVLRPLAEIAPDFVHPETQRTISGHWRDFDTACHPLALVDVIL